MTLCYWNSRCFWFIWVLAHWSQVANFIKETPLLLHGDSTFTQPSYLIPTEEAHGKFSPKCLQSQYLYVVFFSPFQHLHTEDQPLGLIFQENQLAQNFYKHREMRGSCSPLFTEGWEAARSKPLSMCQQPAQRLCSNTSKDELAASRKNTDLIRSNLSTSTQAK